MVDQIEKWKKEEQRELQTEAYHIAQRIKKALGAINFLEWEWGVLIWKAAVAKKEECHK